MTPYDEGCDARSIGYLLSDNPYEEGSEPYKDSNAGWFDTDEELDTDWLDHVEDYQ